MAATGGTGAREGEKREVGGRMEKKGKEARDQALLYSRCAFMGQEADHARSGGR
jgi:hypothetical protein